MEELRSQLGELDEQIIALINQRYRLAKEATADGLPVPDLTAADLERLSMAKLNAYNSGPMSELTLESVYREILSGQFDLVRPVRVGFFGAKSSFTHMATLQKFGESVETISKQTINDVFDDVSKGVIDYGVVPVENSTEGAVTTTFDRFAESNVTIYSEIFLRIHHNLMTQASSIDDVKTVYSHPQVFGQCRRWIQQNLGHCELVEVTSTTAAAERAAEDPTAAALASELAAEKYDLHLLARNIEDFAENVTRFLVLSKHEPEPTGNDKTSLMFAISDRVGALYDSLLPFKHSGVNLAMIQSRPSKSQTWDYIFFVDCLGHASDPAIKSAIDELKEHCKVVKVLGTYPRAAKPS